MSDAEIPVTIFNCIPNFELKSNLTCESEKRPTAFQFERKEQECFLFVLC